MVARRPVQLLVRVRGIILQLNMLEFVQAGPCSVHKFDECSGSSQDSVFPCSVSRSQDITRNQEQHEADKHGRNGKYLQAHKG